MVENSPGPGIPDAGLPFAARALSALQPLVHRAHGWMVDVATHSISKRPCPACDVAPVHALAEAVAVVAVAQLAAGLPKAAPQGVPADPKPAHAPAA